MSYKVQVIALLLVDALMLGAAGVVYNLARFDWGWLAEPVFQPDQMVGPIVLLACYWLLVFFFFGMYRERYAESRFDELVSLVKVVTIGLLVLFFALFFGNLEIFSARENLLFYWASILGLVAVGRIGVRSLQKVLILRGYGTHKALVVGWSEQVEKLYADIARYPAAGLNVVGAIRMEREDDEKTQGEAAIHTDFGDGAGVLLKTAAKIEAPTIADLPRLIDELNVQDVLITLGTQDSDHLMEVLRLTDGKNVALKLVPDFYTVIGGMARTEHMYGLPLIEVLPQPMPAWEQTTKRLIDIAVSAAIILVGLPVWIGVGLLVRFTSPGPAIYRQTRVGRRGKPFTMLKFRTMVNNAEKGTGPVWAKNDDPRYTPMGRWLRKTRLDEVPQLWNVLQGKMSLVGPRPERPFFVEKLAKEIPLYNRRHRVKPGITGWAQIKWKYDESLDDVRQKVKYDLFYIENMSLRMDFKILLSTIRTALKGEGQ